MVKKIDKLNVQDILELSTIQEGMLYHFLKEPAENLYQVQLALTIIGELDIAILRKAIEAVQINNDVLRSVFRWEEVKRPLQLILKSTPVDYMYHDLSIGESQDVDGYDLKDYLEKDQREGFDLTEVPLRFRLYKIASDSFVLSITHHHILYDGWSTGILLKEIFQSYDQLSGKGVIDPLEKTGYKTIRQSPGTQQRNGSEAYWSRYLNDYQATTFSQRTSRSSDVKSDVKHVRVAMPGAGLDSFSASHRVTKAAVVYSAYAILLQKYLNVSDVVFGTVVSNREVHVQGMDSVMGNFINTIPMRVGDLQNRSLLEIIQDVHHEVIERNEFRNTSYSEIKQYLKLKPTDDLFDSAVVIENYPLDEALINGCEGLNISLNSVYENTGIPLVVTVFFNERLEIDFSYRADAVSSQFIASFSNHLLLVIDTIIRSSEMAVIGIDLLSEEDRHQLLAGFNDTESAYPKTETVVSLFEKRVSETPENIALRFGESTLTYSVFNAKAAQLSSYLLSVCDVKAGDLVGVMLAREEYLITSLFGILKAGCAYVPIDPHFPDERIKAIVDDSGLKTVITRGGYGASLVQLGLHVVDLDTRLSEIQAFPARPCQNPAKGTDLAYVLYTSGSTGKPKGVMIEHHSVVNLLLWMHKEYPITAQDVLLQKTPVVFDVSVLELFGWFFTGSSLCILEPTAEKEPAAIVKAIKKYGVTAIHFVPSMLGAFLSHVDEEFDYESLASLRQVFSSGEALKPEYVNAFGKSLNKHGGTRLINLYGPTEATVEVSYFECTFDEPVTSVPIGKPIDNIRLYVLDKSNQLVPIGVPGELCIAGVGLARGYLNNNTLTAEKFVIDPYISGERMYKTGDLARWRHDGNIEYLDRIDDQVKIRGFRIELKEIEFALGSFADVNSCAVICRETGGDKFLVAYYVSAAAPDAGAMKNYLLRKLPVYMVPSYYVRLDKLPLTTSGKLNRKALPAFEVTDGTHFEAPATVLETKLADLWAEIVQIDKGQVSVTKSLFELGGHSLNITIFVNRISKQLQIQVPIQEAFNNPDIKSLAFFISKQTQGVGSSIEKAQLKEYYALSSAQKRLYFLYEFDKSSVAYNGPVSLILEGRLDMNLFNASMKKLISRHEILRTSFYIEGDQPVQRVSADVDFTVSYFESREEDIERLIRDFVRPFTLDQGPLMRVGIARLSAEKHILLVDAHHIVTDGFSQAIMIRDFIALYRDEALVPMRIQYKDYAEWQQSADQQVRIIRERDFWMEEFREEIKPLDLPFDFTRGLVRDDRGGVVRSSIDQESTQRLKLLAEREGVTMFMVVLSVYNILLSKLSNQEDIVIGTTLAGRPHADVEDLIGMFVNTLALRNYPKGEYRFVEFLSLLRARTLASFNHQSYPYEALITDLELERDVSRNALFDVMLSYQNFAEEEFLIPGLRLTPYKTDQRYAKFDLLLFVSEKDGGLDLELEYATGLFTRETVERFISFFKQIVHAVLSDAEVKLSAISILPAAEQRLILDEFNGTGFLHTGDDTVLSVFDRQVLKTPDHIALKLSDKTICYRELAERSSRMGQYLRELGGVKPGDLVGIMLEREEHLIPTILGILKAGAAYIPIDPRYPVERVNLLVEDSGIKLLVSRRKYHEKTNALSCEILDLDERLPEIDRLPGITCVGVSASSLAYVIYTSGSTGKPKGVMIEHGSLLNVLHHLQRAYPLNGEDSYLLKTTHTFDVSVAEIFGWFFNGGSLTILPWGDEVEPVRILSAIERSGVTHINFVPSMFSVFVDDLLRTGTGCLKSLKYIFVAGESLSYDLVKKFESLNTSIQLENIYGPTEGTIYSSSYATRDLGDGQRIPIGKPISNVKLYIVNGYDTLQPIGVPGELWIGGQAVGRGYLHNELLSSEKFINDPFSETGRVYKTGDLARWLPDGNIEYLGRQDTQVKIRGFRIEPGEIEIRLREHAQIRESVVVVVERGGEKLLVGYYVSDGALDVSALRDFLLERLPEYMVPWYYVHLEQMPLNGSGKIDRRQLPSVDMDRSVGSEAATSAGEKLLVSIWRSVLGIDAIGIDDNFFSSGGDSIKSIQICSRVRSAGYELTVKDIFTHPTIKRLSLQLKALDRVGDQGAVEGVGELTPIQDWFFRTTAVDRHHFNQSVLLDFSGGVSLNEVRLIFDKLQDHHDALRMVVREKAGRMVLENRLPGIEVGIEEFDLRNDVMADRTQAALCNRVQGSIDLYEGPLMKLGLFHRADGSRLLIVIHHLVVDGVSWRILFEDLEQLYQQLRSDRPFRLALKTASFLSWSGHLQSYKNSDWYKKGEAYWTAFASERSAPVVRDYDSDGGTGLNQRKASVTIDAGSTGLLLREAHKAFHTEINDILLSALLLTVKRQYGMESLELDLEGHGRENIASDVVISRTVGWFTSIYPVRLSSDSRDVFSLIKDVKEMLRSIPHHGIDYLLQGHQGDESGSTKRSRICFNYLGQFDSDLSGRSFRLCDEEKGEHASSRQLLRYDWDISGLIRNGQLEIVLLYSDHQYKAETIASLLRVYKESLEELIAGCCSRATPELTPSDLTYKGLSIRQLDELHKIYDIADIYTLSPTQEVMLFHSLLEPHAEYFFIQTTCQIHGQLDIGAVEDAMNILMRRYGALRTAFVYENYDRPVQIVLQERRIEFQYADIRYAYSQGGGEDILRLYQEQDRGKLFDLAKDVLIRLTVLQTGDDEFEFIWSHHHIVMDGWCLAHIVKDFKEVYSSLVTGKRLDLPVVNPYSDYIEWLEHRKDSIRKNYWREYLLGYDQLATLSGRRGTSPGKLTNARESELLILDGVQTKRLQGLLESYGITAATVFQCAWGILLAKYNNVSDVVFGSVVSGRSGEIAGIENMVGLFINTIPVRIQYESNETITDFLTKVQHAALESEAYHYDSLAEIHSASELGAGLFDHVMIVENYPISDQLKSKTAEVAAGGFTISNIRSFDHANYDFSIVIIPGDEVRIFFNYNPSLYEKRFIEKTATDYFTVLNKVVANAQDSVARLTLMSEEQRNQVLFEFNRTERVLDRRETFFEIFKEQTKKTPGHTAVVHNGVKLTYASLYERSCMLASALISLGVKPSSRVALLLPRGIDMLASILAVFQAGGAYVPIDIDYPSERIKEILVSSDSEVLITYGNYSDGLKKVRHLLSPALETLLVDEVEWNNPVGDSEYSVRQTTDDLAYIIYTSGTTGKPKGVMIHQLGMINHIYAKVHDLGLCEGDTIAQTASPCFDISVWQFLAALAVGGAVHIIDREKVLDPASLISELQSGSVTVFESVPSLITSFLDGLAENQAGLLAELRWMIPTGESLSVSLVRKWYESFPHVKLLNAYGPTEASDDVTHYVVDWPLEESLRIPIGKPVQNTRIYIVDRHLNLCAPGMEGEICVAGLGVGKGYWRDKEKTDKVFVRNPFSNELNNPDYDMLYKTGDIGYYLDDGNIVCLGRVDQQVKIRGNRIELAEIECLLGQIEGIEEVVVVKQVYNNDGYLVAYYLAAEQLSVEMLQRYLSDRLPAYMIPAYFVQLEEIPVTSNGKLNRAALPDPIVAAQDKHIAPSNDLEKRLLEIWSDVLKVDKALISVDSNFFELGGHSLMAAVLVNKVNKELDVAIPLKEMFEKKSIQKLTDYLVTIMPVDGMQKTSSETIEIAI